MSVFHNIIQNPAPSAPKGIVYGPPGSGKAQPLDAKILTPNGYVTMGDLQVGDKVIGSNGKACQVLGIYPQGEKEVFRVTLLDGSSTECTDDHLWLTQTVTERQQEVAGSVRPLSTIRKTLKYGTHFNHAIPRVKPVELGSDQTLPIDPWLLGVYLGDGHSSTSVVITNSELDIQDRVGSALPDGDQCVLFDKNGLRISRKHEHTEPSLFMSALRDLGIAGHRTEKKFIPGEYLIASIEKRLSLLQGLCDSDGYVLDCGSVVEYTTVSRQLADDVRFLAKSLGADVVFIVFLLVGFVPTDTHQPLIPTNIKRNPQ
ncbi:MAG: hypothetical protein JXM70_07825 [Pirellulales bacterium]|nr:hypothetical protein [Pirellulales bacterium]